MASYSRPSQTPTTEAPAAKRRKIEMIDLTVNLPGGILKEVFSYLTLRDQLRAESVNRRFQKHILELLKWKPQPLEIDYGGLTLNSHQIRSGDVSDALELFAPKAKFDSINIHTSFFDSDQTEYEIKAILSILNSEPECLKKVLSLKLDYQCDEDRLGNLISKCPKLSIVELNFLMTVAWFLPALFTETDKALAELSLHISYDKSGLVEMFKTLKPNTLRKIDIWFGGATLLDHLPDIVRELSADTWAALQEIKFSWDYANIQLAELFDSLAALPSLKTCEIDCRELKISNQFVEVMSSLFKSSISITVKSTATFFKDLTGCQIVALVEQVKRIHSDIKLGFTMAKAGHMALSLSMNNVCFSEVVGPRRCQVVHCVTCHSFYPNVVLRILQGARHLTDAHLENLQLGRCMVGQAVEHLKMLAVDDMKALLGMEQEFVPTGATEEQDLVTLAFETSENKQQFNITVAAGKCFNSCIQCINIE